MKKALLFNLILTIVLSFSTALVQAQCTLDQTYSNTTQVQNAIDASVTQGCTTITVTGYLKFSGKVTVPAGVKLVIASGGVVELNGSGQLEVISEDGVEIQAGGTFMGGQGNNPTTVTIAGVTIPVNGPISGPAAIKPTGVLDIGFINFGYQIISGNVILNWTASADMLGSYFEVERSLTGNKFETIGKVNANMIGAAQKYSFTDGPMMNAYYRIKGMENGRAFYSDIIVVKNTGVAVTIFPNPGKGVFKLNNTNFHNQLVTVTDMMGRSHQVKVNTNAINLEKLNPGVYYIKLPGAAYEPLKIMVTP